MSDSFEVGKKVKIFENNLPYAGTIITYEDNDYKVSVDGLGKVSNFNEDAMELIDTGGGGGGGLILAYHDYVLFSGVQHIELPFTIDSDYRITVEFDALTYAADQSVIGNSGGTTSNRYVHLTQYNNKWYSSTGSGEGNFTKDTTGRHTFVLNKNGYNTFDGENVMSYTPTTSTNKLWIGGRASANNYTGRILSYKIESISSGETICDLKPVSIKQNGATVVSGLRDAVSGEWYVSGIISAGDYS